MELLPGETKPPLPPTPAGSGPVGLLLSRDLIFTSKVKGTAAELGYPMMVAGALSQAKSMIEASRPQVVLVDLTAGELVAPAALVAYQAIAGPDAWFVAFGSHVDVKALAAARAAGCHDVLPRSRFAAELPELMRRYFSQLATRHGRTTADGTASSASESPFV
jgi:DNA-binding NtrC family response regulator